MILYSAFCKHSCKPCKRFAFYSPKRFYTRIKIRLHFLCFLSSISSVLRKIKIFKLIWFYLSNKEAHLTASLFLCLMTQPLCHITVNTVHTCLQFAFKVFCEFVITCELGIVKKVNCARRIAVWFQNHHVSCALSDCETSYLWMRASLIEKKTNKTVRLTVWTVHIYSGIAYPCSLN